MTVGVLALQGDFSKHEEVLHHLGVKTKRVRYPGDLDDCLGLIIPGGESTTITLMIERGGFSHSIKKFSEAHPVFGTCAGLIMMAKDTEDDRVKPLGLLDVSVARNGWGRQVHSFVKDVNLNINDDKKLDGIFIRAPKIKRIGHNIKVLAEMDSEPVLISNGKHMGATFHPELGKDYRIHKYFLEILNG